jgi:hypothetical protein
VGAEAALLVAVADASQEKQGRYLPGTGIPVVPPADLPRFAPGAVLLLPWNLAQELVPLLSNLVPDCPVWVAIPSMHKVS